MCVASSEDDRLVTDVHGHVVTANKDVTGVADVADIVDTEIYKFTYVEKKFEML